MKYESNPTGNLLKYSINTRDGHGGRAEEHRAEMREIAREEIEKAIPQIYQDAYNQAVSDLLSALRADVTTIVDIGTDSGEEIFRDSRTKQAIMNSLYNSIISHLDKQYTLK